MTAIDRYLANLVDVVEGPGYTNDPTDRGGPTRYGITQRTLSRVRGKPASADDVKNLTRDEALAIYRDEYVALPGFDKIAQVSTPVALECIDTGVNMGPQVATSLLQRSLNSLGASLRADGACGPKTVDALKTYLQQRGPQGERLLLVALNCMQGSRYIDITEADPSQKRFFYGWLRQRLQLVPDYSFFGTSA